MQVTHGARGTGLTHGLAEYCAMEEVCGVVAAETLRFCFMQGYSSYSAARPHLGLWRLIRLR